MTKTITINDVRIGSRHPFVLIAGPCVIEDKKIVFKTASSLKDLTKKLDIPFIFKTSYDKANRTSIKSFRGPGIKRGLKILKEIKQSLDVPVLSDVHTVDEVHQAAEVLDVLQIPAFLCRQTDLLVAAGKTGRIVNVKKGQFLAPMDINQAVKKIEHAGSKKILITERGTSFGYNNLVSDFRSIPIMRRTGYPVVFDATHSVQHPGGLGLSSGGDSSFIPLLSRCAIAAGCDGLFMEVHPNPKKALSDGPNMMQLSKMENLLKELKALDKVMRKIKEKECR